MEDFRFAISADKYLDRHYVLVYIEDALMQLLEHKEDNPKVNPTKFFSDYFTSIKEGNHVLFREYAYVQASPHNRASFVRAVWKCFRHIGRKGDLLNVKEYHSLLCLLCPDFPFPPVQKTARIILMDDAMDCLISFSDFLYAFQAQFCYDDFLTKCAETYKTLLETPVTPHDPVVVPTSEENPSARYQNNTSAALASSHGNSDGVDANQFFRALLPVCEKLDLRAPPVKVVKEILSSVERVTFFGFLMAMAKSETLNKSIGKLPCKAELLDISDQELTTPAIRPVSGKKRPPSGARQSNTSDSVPSRPMSSETAMATDNPKPSKTTIAKSSGSGKTLRKVARSQPKKVVENLTSSDDDDDSSDTGSSTN